MNKCGEEGNNTFKEQMPFTDSIVTIKIAGIMDAMKLNQSPIYLKKPKKIKSQYEKNQVTNKVLHMSS